MKLYFKPNKQYRNAFEYRSDDRFAICVTRNSINIISDLI